MENGEFVAPVATFKLTSVTFALIADAKHYDSGADEVRSRLAPPPHNPPLTIIRPLLFEINITLV